jgi:hypothetical protein
MTDIVDNLIEASDVLVLHGFHSAGTTVENAADEITRLRAEVTGLRSSIEVTRKYLEKAPVGKGTILFAHDLLQEALTIYQATGDNDAKK